MIITQRKKKKILPFIICFCLPVFVGIAINLCIKIQTGNKSIEHAVLDAVVNYDTPSEKFDIERQQYKAEIDKLKSEKREMVSRGDVQRTIETAKQEFQREKVVKAIANNLKGVFCGKATYIYDTSKQYSVNPMLVTAISKHETGNGSSYAVTNFNNPGGLMGSKGLLKYDTLEYGIEAMIKNLKANYIDCGLTTIEDIQKKYCPIGASNDPTKLNRFWLPMVTRNYLKILDEAV